MTIQEQPVSSVQWVARDLLRANDYNPNHVAPPERDLLRLSILEDGWTQPIVVRVDGGKDWLYEVVDGFHRWEIAADPQVAALTDGLVPVVIITPDPAHQRMSTIRHNRARGTHHVVKMADIVAALVDELGVGPDEVGRRLGMEPEEVRRLLERGNMTKRGAVDEFSEAWRPAVKS